MPPVPLFRCCPFRVLVTCFRSPGFPFYSSTEDLKLASPAPQYGPRLPLLLGRTGFFPSPFDQWSHVSLPGPTLGTLTLFSAACPAFCLGFRSMAPHSPLRSHATGLKLAFSSPQQRQAFHFFLLDFASSASIPSSCFPSHPCAHSRLALRIFLVRLPLVYRKCRPDLELPAL